LVAMRSVKMGIFDRKPNIEELEQRGDVYGLIKALRYNDEATFDYHGCTEVKEKRGGVKWEYLIGNQISKS